MVDSVYIVKYLQFWVDMYLIVIITPDLSPILMVGYSCGKMQQIKNIAEWIRTASKPRCCMSSIGGPFLRVNFSFVFSCTLNPHVLGMR